MPSKRKRKESKQSHMKIKKYQSDDERSILTGMIVNSRVLARIAAHVTADTKPFRSKWSNVVARWCLEYHAQYQKAPRGAVPILFRSYAEESQDEEAVKVIETFLGTLSDDYKALSKDINDDHLVDTASRYFNQVKLEKLNTALEADLLRKDVEGAREKLSAFTPINLATSSVAEVLTDKELLVDALADNENEVMIRYPRALGEFFGPHLCRDGFIAFLAPEKRGKSFWLIDVAWRAVLNKRKTLIYSLGDMSQRQMMRRFIARAARRPIEPGSVHLPKRMRMEEDGVAAIRTEEVAYANRISVAEAREAMKGVYVNTAHTESLLKMKCTSNSTTRVVDIRTDLDEMAREGWVPDVVVLDYADILAPESGSGDMDYRHQINETWKALRRLSQDYHILVVTATQSDAEGYDRKTLGRKNFSEDKRKLSHVTGMIGLNQIDEEKRKGIFRLNWILLREGDYLETRCVTAAGNLAVAHPSMLSVW